MAAASWCFISILFLLQISLSSLRTLNNRPIIGVLAQHLANKIPGHEETSFINAAYVKYLESSGARVVPIATDISESDLLQLFSNINGVILPGGDQDLLHSAYARNAALAVKYSIEASKRGDYFPVWGTCMGFQALLIIVAGSDKVISQSKGTWDTSLTLDFTDDLVLSRMFYRAPLKLIKTIESKAVTYNAHYNCVSIHAYRKSHELKSFFRVLSTNKDANGEVFLSTIEALHHPIYAVQWHPEMNRFEFNTGEGLGTNIDHSPEAVMTSQYVANFFVNEARKSRHRFPDKTSEEKHLIYNYNPIYSAKYDLFDSQMYLF